MNDALRPNIRVHKACRTGMINRLSDKFAASDKYYIEPCIPRLWRRVVGGAGTQTVEGPHIC